MQNRHFHLLRAIALALLVLSGCSLDDPAHGFAIFRDSGRASLTPAQEPVAESDPIDATTQSYQSADDNDVAIAFLNDKIAADPHSFDLYNARALAYARKKDYRAAIGDFTRAIQIKPNSTNTYFARACAYGLEGKFALANADLERGINGADPRSPRMLEEYAWIRATFPAAQVRSGPEAMKYALAACKMTKWEHASALDALAAASAESGNYSDAVKWERMAMSLPHMGWDTTEIAARLALYAQHKPYRQTDPFDRRA